ncbi:hypothetical protein LTR62_002520 [Meristemomyces frigidus]|uniref:Methyltransferase domain-containing protein n=1 Tax=Meristemomyces frigidus TaxID=1508187 RepID=A0AAN7TSN2_9PEZI|nr:hypothetical protein LTR62_002520 [Meristemomyces frigidus]
MAQHVPEKTFKSFTPEQAAAYATGRGQSYPEPLYEAIIRYHQGKLDTVLDVGTGPGKVVRDMLQYCEKGIGCDASVNMIEQAKLDAAQRGLSDQTSFHVADAEHCDEAVTESGLQHVDLITAGTAAHWFDMPRFYAAAAKALRSGGTIAMWAPSSYYIHPSEPRAEEIQAILSNLEDNYLKPYMQPGSLLARQGYEKLPLPWQSPDLKHLFVESAFEHVDWDLGGVPSAPPLADGTPGPFLMSSGWSMKQAMAGLSSSSPVIRWREAHPDKALTEEDPIMLTANALKKFIGEEGTLKAASALSLLLLRRA